MTISLIGSFAGTVLGFLMGFLSLFLILLVLIQKGKGGGLTGALGGPGGQSAFGSKAGDTFTVITIVVASIWGFTCAFTMWLLGTHTPTSVTETNMSAGPGDEETSPGNELVIPPASSGLGGIGSLDADVDESTETPSAELVPADTTDSGEATEATDSGEATETTDSGDATEGGEASETEGAEATEAESGGADAAATEATDAGSAEDGAGDNDN